MVLQDLTLGHASPLHEDMSRTRVTSLVLQDLTLATKISELPHVAAVLKGIFFRHFLGGEAVSTFGFFSACYHVLKTTGHEFNFNKMSTTLESG